MTNNIFLTDYNSKLLDTFTNYPSHAVLITAPVYSGKFTFAKLLATRLLKLENIGNLDNYPYYNVVSPENNLINIDKIRELKKLFNLKTTGDKQIRRIVIVENAEKMNFEAQNTILKLLEEPPKDSVIILTSSDNKQLFPTILSRLQILRLKNPTLDEAINYFSNEGYKETQIKKHYIFSKGSIGLLSDLLDESNPSNSVGFIEDAKQILNLNRLERLILVESLTKEKDEISPRLFALKRVVQESLYHAVEKGDKRQILKLLNIQKNIIKTENNFVKQGNLKLILTDLMVEM